MVLLLTSLLIVAAPAKPPSAKKPPPKAAKKAPDAPAPAPAPPPDAPVAAPAPPPAPAPAPAPAEAAKKKPVKLAANEWCKSGLDKMVVETIETRFYDLLENAGVDLIAPKDVAAVLGLERQRQIMGCTEEASCLAEIGGALGADAVLYGCVVKAGSGFTATLRAVGTKSAKPVASFSQRVANEDGLQDWLDSTARLMALKVRQELGGESLTAEVAAANAAFEARQSGAGAAPSNHPLRSKAWVPLLAAGAGGALSVVGFVQASAAMTELQARLEVDRTVTTEAEAIAARGNTMQVLGWVGAGVAAAGLGTAAVLFFLPGKAQVAPVVSLGPGGGVIGVSGTLP